MDAHLARIVATQRGFFFRRQALACGYGEKEIAAHLRARDWLRLRRGAYATSAMVKALDPAARHVLVVRAVVASLSGRVVVTGVSGLAVRQVPIWGVDLSVVHVHREDDKTSRRDAGVAHHRGDLPAAEITEIDGLLVASPEVCAFDAARTSTYDAGVALVDGVRHRWPFDLDRARTLVEQRRDWSGSINANRVLGFSSDRAATVGESRGRILMARIGLPPPTLQHPVRSESGALLGTTDFYLPDESTVAEFDGRLKYGRGLYEKSGQLNDIDLGDVVWQEKRREDAIRDQGYEMVRFVWSELDGMDSQLNDRFQRAFRRAGRLRQAS